MLRSSLYAAGALLLSASALAQTDASSKVQPITSQVKQGGTFHAATKTWTRNVGPTANLSGVVLYDNTCTVGSYFLYSPMESVVDNGRIPSTTSPTSGISLTGTADLYTVDGFEVAYCTSELLTTDLIVAHYDCYGTSQCQNQVGNATLVSALAIGGAPASAVGGSLSCWAITINLRNSTLEFDMNADCNGVYGDAGGVITDLFAWEMMQDDGGTPLGNAGPLIAGDPFGILGNNCPYGAGTVWSSNPTPGTGLSTQDAFTSYIPGPSFSVGSAQAGCWFFGGYTGGNPYASFYHLIRGDAGSPSCPISEYCNGDGSGTPCPLGNNNDGSNGIAGCATSAAAPAGPGGGKLTYSGCSVVAAGDLVLQGSDLPLGQPGLYFQADNAINGGNGVAFGDGLRCAGGNVRRLQVRSSGATGTSFTTINIGVVGGVSAGQTKRYQLWFRDPAQGVGFNFTNALEVLWQ